MSVLEVSTEGLAARPDDVGGGRPSGVLPLLRRSPMAAIGIAITVVLLVVSFLGPLLLPIDPTAIHRDNVLSPPSAAFPFGTDELGRDLLARVVAGARLSFVVGGAAMLLGTLVGVSTGVLAGYFGRAFEVVVMRLWDVLLAFPGALLGIATATAMGPGVTSVVVAGALSGVPFFSRLARASTLVERERDYVVAARALGASDARILGRHILPNSVSPILVQMSNTVGQAILLEAALSYLGLGIQPPEPSLGTMLNEAQGVLGQAPWYPVYPGLTLVVLLVGLNFLTDGLHGLLVPRRR